MPASADPFPGTPPLAVRAAWAAIAAVVLALLADATAGLDAGVADPLHRWGLALCGALAAGAVVARTARVERERQAWLPLAIGVSASALAELARAVAPGDGGAAHALGDGLALAFYPCACATIVSLVRRSFVRAPAAVWVDGLIAALTFAAAGIAIAPPAERPGLHAVPPLGDLGFVVLVLAIAAMTSWRPGRRWLLLGAATLAWFVSELVAGDLADVLVTAGLGLLAAAAWAPPGDAATEAPTPDGARVLLLPAGFSVGALALLALDHLHALNGLTVVLALAAVLVALARTTLTLREYQLLAEARHEAQTDALTGLPSRRHFHRRLEVVLREAEAEGLPFALLIFDLDRFKELNDTLGHAAGDTLLQLVASRLTEALAPEDALVARLGGDEFAVLMPPGTGAEAALTAGTTVVDAVARPFAIDGLALDVGVSVGVALHPDHASDESELMRRADVAMYLAKGAGGGVALYDPARDLHTRDRLALGQQLRQALDGDELEVFFQPQADPQLGRVLGLEALVRWRHPVNGLLSPADFLPLAARSGAIGRITRHVLDVALGQLARWRADGLELTVAVNLAASDLLDPDLPADVLRALADHGVPAHLLTLEVREDGLLGDEEATAATLDVLARRGVRIALDDYGTGRSSLLHLRRLPVAELKLDRALVTTMATDEDGAAIVATTLELARSLRLSVVAEGVEDEATWALLAELGADAIQGFALGHPLSAAQATAWLAARREGPIARAANPDQASSKRARRHSDPIRTTR
jgi:diguanylate cyclase